MYTASDILFQVDVTSHHQLVQFHSQVTQDFGDVTILVNNAGIIYFSDSSSQDFEQVQRVAQVNFVSHVWLNQLFLPHMKNLNRGFIMAVSSLSSLFGSPELQVYAATKSAVKMYMSSLRVDLKRLKYRINLTTIMPTYMNTQQNVEEIIRSNGQDKLTPFLDGEVVAREAVESMLTGIEELTLPRVCGYLYKLQV